MKRFIGLLAVLIITAACNAPLSAANMLEPTPEAPQIITFPTSIPTSTPIPTPTTTPEPSLTVHIVQPGETLSDIAARYGITPEAIASLNDLLNVDSIYADQELLIPPPDSPLDLFPTVTTIPTVTPAPFVEPTVSGPYGTGESNVLYRYSIPYLSSRDYDGGEILLEEYRGRDSVYDVYRQYSFSHTSDGIYVTGLVNIPEGEGPFPVALILHGGIDQSGYYQGWGTANHADRLARAGYIAFMPDYQTYNDTQGTGSPLKIPWAIDVMNLIDALPSLPEADPERIGVMGHSRGGGLASYIMVLAPQVDAVVLYAPLHLDQTVTWNRYVNVFSSQWPLIDARTIGTPEENPLGYQMVSPWYYLEQTAMPVQIHHGTADATLPIIWSRDLYDRMQTMDLEVELYEYTGGGHTLLNADYTTFITRMIAFFDREVK